MTDQSLEATLTDKLTKPFPPQAIKKNHGGFDYVEGHTVAHRLIDATDNQFEWKVTKREVHPCGFAKNKPDGSPGAPLFLVLVDGDLTIYGLGTRSGTGVQIVEMTQGREDVWKGANTDALKNAAHWFGVGLHLYGPDYEAGEADNRPQPTERNIGAVSTPGQATEKQQQLIKNLQAVQKLSNAAMLEMTGGKKLEQLSKAEASALIDRLNAPPNER